LKQDIESYYADPAAPITTKKNQKAWRRVQAELTKLKEMEGALNNGDIVSGICLGETMR
jgi:hypothetical protein